MTGDTFEEPKEEEEGFGREEEDNDDIVPSSPRSAAKDLYWVVLVFLGQRLQEWQEDCLVGALWLDIGRNTLVLSSSMENVNLGPVSVNDWCLVARPLYPMLTHCSFGWGRDNWESASIGSMHTTEDETFCQSDDNMRSLVCDGSPWFLFCRLTLRRCFLFLGCLSNLHALYIVIYSLRPDSIETLWPSKPGQPYFNDY